jgi:hypothetical protein
MKSKFFESIKGTFYSSVPLAFIIIVCLLIAPLSSPMDYLKIIIGYVCVVFGQSMFLVGLWLLANPYFPPASPAA